MSGVQAGTRLERLQVLWRRTKHDLDIAQREGQHQRLAQLQQLEARLDEEIVLAGGTSLRPESRRFQTFQRKRPARGQPRGPRRKAEDRVSKHLERLGVTSHDVKVWAVAQGLLPAVKRGRIKGELVTAYESGRREGAA